CFEGGDIDWDDEDLDSMECFEFVYPVVVVFPGGATVETHNDDEMYEKMESWFDENEDSDEYPTYQFPLQVTLADGTTQTVENDDELELLLDDCLGDDWDEDMDMDDMEEMEIAYPITAILPDGSTQQVNNDDELIDLYDLVDENFEDADLTFEFPIEIKFEDGETITIENQEEWDELFMDDMDMEDFFEFVYPLTIKTVEATDLIINNEDELYGYIDNTAGIEDIEDVYFVFPITLDFGDGETETINSQEEFDALFTMDIDDDWGDDDWSDNNDEN
ncbi:MAG: hypothetical protein MI922_27615, partial [Bacteroidales bacterium]|nr:hypothetical protein [Bacteroidales bacterium]